MMRTLLFACCLLVGCSRSGDPQANLSHDEKAQHEVLPVLRDGDGSKFEVVTAMEKKPRPAVEHAVAAELADSYFRTFFGACGDTTVKGETEITWVFRTAVGFSGTPGANIVVAKDGTCVFSDDGAQLFAREGQWVMDSLRFRTFADEFTPALKEKTEANQRVEATSGTRPEI